MYGKDIALERFRPNGDKYSASKITEASIKIELTSFCKRIEERIHLYKNIKKERKKSLATDINNIDSPGSSNTNNYLNSSYSNSSSSYKISKENSDIQREEINKGLIPESSSSLSNFFKSNTIIYNKI